MTSKEGSHDRALYLMHRGYSPGRVEFPSIGSITAMEVGDRSLDLPNYISIGRPSPGAGFLPPEFNPYMVWNPGDKVPNLDYPAGVNKELFRERIQLLQAQEKDFVRNRGDVETEKHRVAYDKADKMMHSPLIEAFDFSKEQPKLRAEYGDTPFGKGCLLARRLVEKGVKFIEVNLTGWDTHQNNFTRTTALCKKEGMDAGMATLIRDLHDRRMLESTLVVWMGEFGRTPNINGSKGRDHWPRGWTLALAGGGIQGGRVIGSTDANGMEVKDRPVTVPDLFATIYKTLGVDIKKKNMSPLGSPIQITDYGVPVKELLN